jgi:hypothetical protein
MPVKDAPQQRFKKVRDFALGFSIANLLLLSVWSELLFTNKTATYYMFSPPGRSDYLAAVVNTFLLGTLLFGVVQLIRWRGRPWHLKAARIVFIIAVLIAANIYRFQFTTNFGIGVLTAKLSKSGMLIPAFVAGAVLVLIAIYLRRFVFQIVTIFILLLAPFGVITTAQALVKGLTANESQLSSADKFNLNRNYQKGPRVVWIIFDELDEGILFKNRPPRLFPAALDSFWFSSTRVFNARSPSNLTSVSIPSLLTGIPLVEAHPQNSSELNVVSKGSSASVPLTNVPNIFSKTKSAGFQTTAVGWYHPYCRLFQKDLDNCSWQPVFQTITGQVPAAKKNIPDAMLNQLASINPLNRRRLAIQAYQNILSDSKKVLKRTSGLIFLHFPIPHPPAIYNRNSERLTTINFSNVKGYVDNVGLVDRAFQQLQLTMQDAGVWDETTVIVSSDHPWRDATSFHGKESLYVPFLLKMPHQTERIDLHVLFETVKTSELVLAILNDQLKTDKDAAQWIESNSVPMD